MLDKILYFSTLFLTLSFYSLFIFTHYYLLAPFIYLLYCLLYFSPLIFTHWVTLFFLLHFLFFIFLLHVLNCSTLSPSFYSIFSLYFSFPTLTKPQETWTPNMSSARTWDKTISFKSKTRIRRDTTIIIYIYIYSVWNHQLYEWLKILLVEYVKNWIQASITR